MRRQAPLFTILISATLIASACSKGRQGSGSSGGQTGSGQGATRRRGQTGSGQGGSSVGGQTGAARGQRVGGPDGQRAGGSAWGGQTGTGGQVRAPGASGRPAARARAARRLPFPARTAKRTTAWTSVGSSTNPTSPVRRRPRSPIPALGGARSARRIRTTTSTRIRVLINHSGGDHGMYQGPAWYRKHFKVPANVRGQQDHRRVRANPRERHVLYQRHRRSGRLRRRCVAVRASTSPARSTADGTTDNVLAVRVDKSGGGTTGTRTPRNPAFGGLTGTCGCTCRARFIRRIPLYQNLKTSGHLHLRHELREHHQQHRAGRHGQPDGERGVRGEATNPAARPAPRWASRSSTRQLARR